MKTIKKALLRIFFAFEIVVFSFVYLFGAQGLSTMRQLKQEDTQLQTTLVQLEQEVQTLTIHVAALKTNPFYLEKIARENLHMARKDEVIYVYAP
jgi:cell division protein FtsB